MKKTYQKVTRPVHVQIDRYAELEAFCRTEIRVVLQAYLDTEVDELIQRALRAGRERNANALQRSIVTVATPSN